MSSTHANNIFFCKDLQCLLVSLLVPVCEHLAEDISHSAIYWSSETFPFSTEGFYYSETLACVCVCVCMHAHAYAWHRANKRFKERASNCSEMSQKGGLARGYKLVVGVRAFLAEDQTESSTAAKSVAVFFPHSAFPYHCCSTITAHALGLVKKKTLGFELLSTNTRTKVTR